MSDHSAVPSPLQILAKVNAALEASGLKQFATEREPLPLFWHLLNEWLVTQELTDDEVSARDVAAACLAVLPLAEVREALHKIHREALQLSRAHLRLNDWSQRELESEYRTLLSEVEAAHRLRDVSGY